MREPIRRLPQGHGSPLSGAASRDLDDGIASYAWTQTGTTTVTLTNANTVSASFTAPNVTAQTVLTFQLTVRDRLPQSSTDTIAITVRPAGTPPPNQAPVANAGSDQTVNSGVTVSLNGSLSSDLDNGIASYAWSQTGTPAVSLSNTTVANPTFTAPQVTATTTLTFTLRVTDPSGLSSTDTCLVTVNPPGSPNNKLPVANAGVDMMVLPGNVPQSRRVLLERPGRRHCHLCLATDIRSYRDAFRSDGDESGLSGSLQPGNPHLPTRDDRQGRTPEQ